MSGQGKFWQAVEKKAKKNNPEAVSVGVVKSLSPFTINYNGLELSAQYGDTIYVNNLMLDENIDLDKVPLANPQTLASISAQYLWYGTASPNTKLESKSFTATISGTQLQFLTDFYDWAKAVHNRYILHIGDYIAVQKLGHNTYIVLQKLQKVTDE